MTSPFNPVRLFRVTETGWQECIKEAWYVDARPPVAVQKLYIAEGWEEIFYQELLGGPDLVYPLILSNRISAELSDEVSALPNAPRLP